MISHYYTNVMSTGKELLSQILADPESLSGKSKQELLDIYSKTNPYGRVLDAINGTSCISVTNCRDNYIANFKMTSVAGFLYRMLREYDDLFAVEEVEKTPEQVAASTIKQAIVKQFLDRVLEYNPELHVSSAFVANPLDPERFPTSAQVPATGVGAHIEVGAVRIPVPAHDAFHRWRWYEESNYESLRAVTAQLYADKPDLEFAIQVHQVYTGPNADECARTFIKENNELVTAPIIAVTNNTWTLLGAFKQNRDRMEFYNKDNEVIKSILDRTKKDQDYGAQLMNNRVMKKKKKNIDLNGGINAATENDLRINMGVNNSIISEDDRRKLCEYATTTKADTDTAPSVGLDDDDDVPDDAVIVKVFTNDGKGKLKESEFYTKVGHD